MLQFGGFAEATILLWQTLNTVTVYRCGAEAARRADNPEVTGSKPVVGISTLRPFTEAGNIFHRYSITDITQFTLGSEMQDQYLLPVSVHFARFTEAGRHSLSDVKQHSGNRCGAEASARGS